MANPIRRAQLITPFGVGAITVLKRGTSVICCGLDHWFKREGAGDGAGLDIDRQEFRVDEPRLERLLGVGQLLLPPDFRKRSRHEQGVPNQELTIPFLRFPKWHQCSRPECGRIDEFPLSRRDAPRCPACRTRGRQDGPPMHQVRFVAMCERGHIRDFPWREWVHESATPACREPLRLRSSGGASLAAIRVTCGCGASRSLEGVMEVHEDGTTRLSKQLDSGGNPYVCDGRRPWLGEDTGTGCGAHLVATLPNATNVYFASMESAIYLPKIENAPAPSELIDLLDRPPFSTLIHALLDLKQPPAPQFLRVQHGRLLGAYTDDQITAAIEAVTSGQSVAAPKVTAGASFREEEYQVLQQTIDRRELRIRRVGADRYTGKVGTRPLSDYIAGISLVDKLRETRVLAGFTRMRPEVPDVTLEDKKRLLLKSGLPDWLPAYVVFGEGIFIEFRTDRLLEWEGRAGQRIQGLSQRFGALRARGWGRDIPLGPRFVLLHTFAHILMNRLVFDCGYSSSALRERLYVSMGRPPGMAGVLIYTADGDSEGTLGGLVRMGEPGRLEPVVRRALESAMWCAADPVCQEMGDLGGQGPDSCNLAACHNCALVPETACEQFNRFLDRGVVVGTLQERHLGFFELDG